MQYPMGSGRYNTEIVTSSFGGLNRKVKGREGDFSDCRNVASDNYPSISTASGYEDTETGYTNIQAAIAPMYGATKFCGVADGIFYWDGEAKTHILNSHYQLSRDSEIQMYVINGYIYIREKKANGKLVLYRYDVYSRDGRDWGCVTIPYQLRGDSEAGDYRIQCIDGGDYEHKFNLLGPYTSINAGTTLYLFGEEDEEQFITYKENTGLLSDTAALYVSPDVWINLKDRFQVFVRNKHGETKWYEQQILLNCHNKDNPAGVWDVGAIYKNIVPKSVPFEQHKNRVWAGRDDGGAIYATSHGSGDDYWSFSGIASDSVEIEISSPGEFVGFKSYNNSLLCFKRDSITVIYGDLPDNFSIGKEMKGIGCIDIRSAQILDGVLYFLGADGFYAYSGGWPQFISDELNTRYKEAIAFVQNGKYYAEGTKEDGTKEMAVYDARRGIWLLEDAQNIRGVYYMDKEVYIVTENAVKRHLPRFEYEETDRPWYFESMDLYESIFDKKGINELFIRARLNEGAEITVSTRNEEGELLEHKSFRGTGQIQTYRIPVRFSKKEAYRYRISGIGPAVIYEILRKVSAGGKNIYEE